jgi:hypothetical protein
MSLSLSSSSIISSSIFVGKLAKKILFGPSSTTVGIITIPTVLKRSKLSLGTYNLINIRIELIGDSCYFINYFTLPS